MTGVHLHHPPCLLELQVVDRLGLDVEADQVVLPAQAALLHPDHVGPWQLVGEAELALLGHLSHLLAEALWLQGDS